MTSSLRTGLAFGTLLLLAMWLIPLGSVTWADWFLNDHIYVVSFGWLSWASLIAWSYYAIWFIALGAVLHLLAPSPQSAFVALALGCAYSLVRILRSRYQFFDTAPIADYFWVFGELIVPPLSACLGAFVAAKFAGRRMPESHGA